MSKASEFSTQMAKACAAKPADFIVGTVVIASVDGAGELALTGRQISAKDALALAAWITLNFGG